MNSYKNILRLRSLPPLDTNETHTSVLLKNLINRAGTTDNFTFAWLMGSLSDNIYGLIVLFLSLLSFVPIIDIAARFILLLVFCQGMLGYPAPILPQKFLLRKYPVKYLVSLERRAIPLLEYFEKFARPRWLHFLIASRRISALLALLLTVISLLIPLPFANVPIAIVSALMALAYIEHDGVLLAGAISISLGILMIVGFLLFS
jgi:hypothetical protein